MEREQHIKILKKLIEQNEQALADMRTALTEIDQKRIESERKHRKTEVSNEQHGDRNLPFPCD